MGTILIATCPCGYESEPLFVGSGLLEPPGVFRAPACCKGCGTVIVSAYPGMNRCGRCKATLIFYNDPALWAGQKPDLKRSAVFAWRAGNPIEVFVLPDVPYFCPACGKKTMRFMDAGCWD